MAIKQKRLFLDNEREVFHTFKLGVIILWVIFGMIQKISFFEKIWSSRILIAVMLAGAAACILWDFLRIHSLFKNRFTWKYALFIAATVFSSILWIRYGVYSNAVIICYLCAELFMMYQFDADRGKEALYRDFRIICKVVCVVSLVFSLFSLLTYFAYVKYAYQDAFGRVISQGYHPDYRRIWGVYIETNFQGIMDIFVIYMSLLFAYKSNSKKERILWSGNLVVHFICLVLTSSRSSAIAFYVSVFAFSFFLSGKYISKKCRLIQELGKRLAAAVLTLAVSFGVFVGVKNVMPYIQMAVVNNISFESRLVVADAIDRLYMWGGLDIWGELADYVDPSEDETLAAEPTEGKEPIIKTPEKIVRQDIEDKEDTSNGRMHVWLDGLKLFTKFPLFGVSPGNRAAVVNEKGIDVCSEIKSGYTLLNGYLEVLVGSGLLGFVFFLLFLLACVVRLVQYDRKYGKHRIEIACIFGAIVGQMVFSLFLSELFYIKSVNTYLFWILLGYAIAVIEIEERESAEQQDYAFICDTPLQVLNAVSCVASNTENCAGKSDLFLYHQFRNSSELSERIKQSGVFRNVFDFTPFPKKSGIGSKIITFGRILNPRWAMDKQYRGKTKDYKKYKYGTLGLSFYTPFSDIVHLVLDTSRVIQYEDGTASYVTPDLESRYRSGIFEAYNKYIACGKLSYHAEMLYLSNPAFCAFDSAIPLKKYVSIADDKKVLATAKDIFGYEASLYKNAGFVYLTQPFGPAEGGEAVTKAEQECLPLLKQVDPIVRIHPRQSAEGFSDFTVDTVGNMWELECAESIDDQKVLIGAFSTAQLAPKMMFDREPTLVFLYKLYGCRFSNADKMVERIREAYRDPAKIMVPETKQELASILNLQ